MASVGSSVDPTQPKNRISELENRSIEMAQTEAPR